MSKPDEDELPVIPPDHDTENWLNTARKAGAGSATDIAAAKARALAEKLREPTGPKAESRPNQGRQLYPKTRTNSQRTTTSRTSGSSAAQLALTLRGPSVDRQR